MENNNKNQTIEDNNENEIIKNNELQIVEDNNESKKVEDNSESEMMKDNESQKMNDTYENEIMEDNEDQMMDDTYENEIMEDNEDQMMEDELLEMEDIGGLYGMLIAEIHNFSKEDVHIIGKPSVLRTVFADRKTLNLDHVPEFYANGINDASKGYVSILFEKPRNLFSFSDSYYFEIIFIISVIDAEGNKRFTQSLTLERDVAFRGLIKEFCLEKYISRETLLYEPCELLSEDTLTLCIEINQQRTHDFIHPDVDIEEYLESCFDEVDSQEYNMLLDSDLGKRLSEESVYFQRMLDTPMIEKQTQMMKLCLDEYVNFLNIGRIMMGAHYIDAYSIADIYTLYIVADKYDIPIVTDICRHLFEKRICDGNVELIFELAHTFNDDHLKRIVERFQNDSVYQRKRNEVNTEWDVESIQLEPQCISDYERKPKLDFYI